MTLWHSLSNLNIASLVSTMLKGTSAGDKKPATERERERGGARASVSPLPRHSEFGLAVETVEEVLDAQALKTICGNGGTVSPCTCTTHTRHFISFHYFSPKAWSRTSPGRGQNFDCLDANWRNLWIAALNCSSAMPCDRSLLPLRGGSLLLCQHHKFRQTTAKV